VQVQVALGIWLTAHQLGRARGWQGAGQQALWLDLQQCSTCQHQEDGALHSSCWDTHVASSQQQQVVQTVATTAAQLSAEASPASRAQQHASPPLTISSAPLITPHRMLQYLSSLYSSGSSTKSARGLSARIWRAGGHRGSGGGGQCQRCRGAGAQGEQQQYGWATSTCASQGQGTCLWARSALAAMVLDTCMPTRKHACPLLLCYDMSPVLATHAHTRPLDTADEVAAEQVALTRLHSPGCTHQAAVTRLQSPGCTHQARSPGCTHQVALTRLHSPGCTPCRRCSSWSRWL
jgi:hypothetical protein